MMPSASELKACALGLLGSHVRSTVDGHRLVDGAAEAFEALGRRAAKAGLDLKPVSSWRSYARQLTIFNAKVSGRRPVHDDAGLPLERAQFSRVEWLHRVLRFSALPGTSRHHWGSDVDVCDLRALPQGYTLQLSPDEYRSGGVQADVADWLLERVRRDDAEGFTLPYGVDRGGVAPEPWHLSHRATAARFSALISPEDLLPLWRSGSYQACDSQSEALNAPLEYYDCVTADLEALWSRYVCLD